MECPLTICGGKISFVSFTIFMYTVLNIQPCLVILHSAQKQTMHTRLTLFFQHNHKYRRLYVNPLYPFNSELWLFLTIHPTLKGENLVDLYCHNFPLFEGWNFYQLLQYLSGEFFFQKQKCNSLYDVTSLTELKKTWQNFRFLFPRKQFFTFLFHHVQFYFCRTFTWAFLFFVEILSLLTKYFLGRFSMYCKNVLYPVIYFLQLLFTCLSFVFDFLICM